MANSPYRNMFAGIAAIIFCACTYAQGEAGMTNVHDFVAKSIDGEDVKLSVYSGKVLLIVNVASKCGFTGQYAGLQALYEKYEKRGFVILGFPSNDFLRQEPGTDAEIKSFCTLKYGVTFPMFSKIVVKGDGIHPLYEFLTSEDTNPEYAGAISWNFNKFLVTREGLVAGRFGSRTKPDAKDLTDAIESALGEPASGQGH